MVVQIRESTIEEIQEKLEHMNTALNKISYLESALNIAGFSFEIKRFLYGELAKLYEDRRMFERAGKSMANKAGTEISIRDKIESCINAADFFSRAGKIHDAEDMFIRAARDAEPEQKQKVKLARKNIYMSSAKELESKARKASAVKFYEKLIKMNLEEIEKQEIKKKLLSTYKALGMFREAKLLDGM